ncbi:hypothetical protein BJV78DRAFT_1279426 [Lactifluus subvellereus]|nr:hypothetical protein BJV78DRAFT_1279426 [Lactifluus subvellereus]
MTLANDGLLLSSDRFILATSPSSQPQSSMHPHSWPADLWSYYYTPNRCTCTSNTTHDSSTFDQSCVWTPSSANLPPSTEQLKRIYPSPPPTDSDPKHTVPLPALCEDPSPYAAGISARSYPRPLTLPLPCTPAPLTEASEGPLTSHPSSQGLPLSPPPSLPMVPQPLPEDTTSCCTLDTLDKDSDAHTDDRDSDVPDGESQSSSSPEEPPPTDLLTPLSPIWDLSLDDTDPRPVSTLEVSSLTSRSLVSPLAHHSMLGVQTTEVDRMTLSCGFGASIRDLDPAMESQCGPLRSLVVSPGGRASSRFSMFHTFFSSPNCDGIPFDGLPGHSQPSSGGKLFVDPPPLNPSHPDPEGPHILPHLTLLVRPLQLQRRISLPPPSLAPEESGTDTRRDGSYALIAPCHRVATTPSQSAPLAVPQYANVRVNHQGTESSAGMSNVFQEPNGYTLNSPPPSPLSDCSPGASATQGSDFRVTSDLGLMDVDDSNSSDDPSRDFGDFEQQDAPSSPMRRTLPDLPDDIEDFLDSSPVPMSPSRRSFAELPEDIVVNEPSASPPQSPLLAGQPLLTLPGAEPDNNLIVSETPVSEWSAASPPRGSGLGLFLPIQAASSNQPETSETHAVEPNLNFSREAIARVNTLEFEKLKSVRRRTWVSERKAKEDEVFHAERAEHLAGRLSVAPPVPSKLADFDERGGVSAGADADDTEGPPGEPAQLDESDEKTIRTWLLYTEARRAEARRVRKREKECGRELQALLRLKLGEDPDATEQAGSAKVKPGKTAIVSMPQLVARMIMKRRYTPRPFSPRKHDSPYISSPLSKFELEPAAEDCDMDMEI